MRSRPSLLISLLLAWFLLVLVFDLVGSLALVNSLGPQVEGNGIVRSLLGSQEGLTFLFLLKGGEIIGVLAGCLYLYDKKRWVGVLGAFLVALTQTYFAVRVLAAFAILGEAFGA